MRGKSPSSVARIYVPQCHYCVLLPINVHFSHYSNLRLSLNIIHLPQLELGPENRGGVGLIYPNSLSTIHQVFKNK